MRYNNKIIMRLLDKSKTDNEFIYQVGYSLKEYDELKGNNIVERNIFLFFSFERWVLNGGIDTFLYMPSGRFTHETIEMLDTIGLTSYSDPIKELAKLLPNGRFQYDNKLRQSEIDDVKETDVWKSLVKKADAVYYGSNDDMAILSQRLAEYIKANCNKIEHWKSLWMRLTSRLSEHVTGS